MSQKNTSNKKLAKYNNKRDFKKTKEPKGGRQNKFKKIFVIQKHDATNLHYDFRIEIDGVLVSWAVPKGPSTDPSEKRFAKRTEDHPLDYASFEGIIPKEEYGGGTVLIWDKGKYKNLRADKENDKANMKDSLKEGKIEIELKGKKLEGGYNLIRMGAKKDGNWLLIKSKDDKADARRNPVNTEPKSVKSGKTLKEIAKENE